MEECVHVDAGFPVRQGDVLKRVRGDGQSTLVVVVTADCDIANGKFGDAGLACVQLDLLTNHVLGEYARGRAQSQLRKRFEAAAKWINTRWTAADPQNLVLSEDHVRAWILESEPEEIEAALDLPVEDKTSFIKKESVSLKKAHAFVNEPVDRYSSIDAMCALQGKSRSDQLKSLFGNLNPKDLPLDLFYVSSVPGEPGLGFVAKLRALTFIPFELSFTSMDAAKDVENSFVRVGRLKSTFRHALAQQFGMLFARIGMPEEYEQDRDAAFLLIADELKTEMGAQQ